MHTASTFARVTALAVGIAGALAISENAERTGDRLKLHPNGFALFEAVGEVSVADG